MSERRLGNFNSCCRLCLSEKLGTLKSIFEDESRGQEIAKNIKTSLGVQIHSTDKLTTMICNTCSEQVNGWHSFRRGCIENQTTLIRRMNSFFQSNMGNITIQIKDEVVEPDERPIDVEDDDVVHVKAERIDETENLDASYDRGEILDDNSFELPPPLTPNMPDQLSHMNNDNENAMSDDQDDDYDEGMNMLVPFVEFSEGDTLLNGELDNHNSDDKTCTICGKHFSTPANRKKHERMVHLRKNKNFKTLKHILNEMGYEKEQKTLLQLLQETDTYITEYDDDEDDIVEEDIVEERETDSESEQELLSETEEEEEGPKRKRVRIDIDPLYYSGRDKISLWKKHISTSERFRIPFGNIHLPGVKEPAKKLKSEFDLWSCLMGKDILNIIVKNTNKHIANANYNVSNRNAHYTDLVEIRALLGLLYLSAVKKTNHLNPTDLWKTNGTAIELFRLTMSLERFCILLRHLRFEDEDICLERSKFDKLAPIRELFEMFNLKCQEHYSLSEYVTIDEKLVSFKGRCSFRQYIPNKPKKYGLKMFALADAKTFYTSKLEVYVGQQPKGPYCVDNSSSAVIQRLCEPILGTKRNLTIDNWFTSKQLADKLLNDHQITMVGSIKNNKPEIPKEFVEGKTRPVLSSMFSFQQHCTVMSYIPKENKNILLISTMQHYDEIDPLTGKPEIITFYNSTKDSVAVIDKLCESYNTARATRRWPTVIFYSLLNIAAINAFIMYNANNAGKVSRSQFLENLALSLLREHLTLRSSHQHIPRLIQLRTQEILGIARDNPAPRNYTPGRCNLCSSRKNRKTRYYCNKCNKYLCLEHAVIICSDCNL